MINDLKDLKNLLKLCRAQGITDFKMNGIEIKFGDLPSNSKDISNGEITEPLNPYANFPTGDLTPEQLMFYSSGGVPEDDPNNKELVS